MSLYLRAKEIWITTGEGKAQGDDGKEYTSPMKIGSITAVDKDNNWYCYTIAEPESLRWIFTRSENGAIVLFRDYWKVIRTPGDEGALHFDAIYNAPKKLLNRASHVYSAEENAYREKLRKEYIAKFPLSDAPRLKTLAIVE